MTLGNELPAMQMNSPASDPLGLEPREEPLRAQATTVYGVPSSHINRMQPGQNIVSGDSGVSGSTLGWLSILALSTAGAYMAGKSVDKLGGRTSAVTMSQESQEHVTRRDLLAQAAGSSALFAAAAANAEVDYAGVGFLGGSKTIDCNNANIRVYTKLPGMYPTIAGLIVSKAPYKDKAEMYTKTGMTAAQAAVSKKYDASFIYLEPRPEYMIDNINNGLYR
jgi:photosystem II PsbU protein